MGQIWAKAQPKYANKTGAGEGSLVRIVEQLVKS